MALPFSLSFRSLFTESRTVSLDYKGSLKRSANLLTQKFQLDNYVDPFEGNSLMKQLVKTGHLDEARSLFDRMPQRDEISWTTIISGYVGASNASEALGLFSTMWTDAKIRVDPFILSLALKACGKKIELKLGESIHCHSVKTGFVNSVFVGSALLDMYTKSGALTTAHKVFDEMPVKNVVSWTGIITGLVHAGQNYEALRYFSEMWLSDVECDSYTFASAAKACADSGALNCVISACGGLVKIHWGRQLHAHVLRLGIEGSMSIANATMTMYTKCGSLHSAAIIFDDMHRRDVVSWSAMIAGYCQESLGEEAFELFSRMRREGPKANEFTLASLLSLCASIAILEQGKQIHAHVLSVGVERDPMINSALINMYSKCGSIGEAKVIFYLGNDDVVSWTAMINGFAEHGYSREAIDLFQKMTAVGIRPDSVTFIGVLSACSHVGLVDLGFHYFNSMSKTYQINPGKEHYGCMVDLLCRAGQLSDAESLIHKMPFKPDDVFWSTLLRACGIHVDVERARRTAKKMLELDPYGAGTHITISNIYSASGMWKDAAYMRKLMKSKGVRKEPGWSCIKVIGKLSAFVAGDRSHPQNEKIYDMLYLLASQAEIADSNPQTNYMLSDLEDL